MPASNPTKPIDPLSAAFGRRVSDPRRQHGEMAAVDLAARAGMSAAYLWRIEAGLHQVSLRNAARIAAGFGISLSALFDGMEVPPGALGKRGYVATGRPGRPPGRTGPSGS